VVKAPDTEPRPSNWVDYYVPGDGTVIQDMDLFQGHCAMCVEYSGHSIRSYGTCLKNAGIGYLPVHM
jgi:hypothetical protein